MYEQAGLDAQFSHQTNILMQQIKIKVGNPAPFDKTVQSIGACALLQKADGQYETDADGNYTLRIFANAGYIKFAINNQGYGTIVQ